jgi:hypothetical protein
MHFAPDKILVRRLAAAAAASALTLSALLPSGALAVESQPQQQVGQQPTPVSLPSCTDKAWATPTVIVHTALFSGTSNELAGMQAAVRDINAQMAHLGDSAVSIDKTQFTTDEFHETAYKNTTPTIHVGFLNLTDGALAETNDVFSCEHYITVDRATLWDYGTPEDSTTDGDRYFDANLQDPSNKFYFRISYQHELLHAFSVASWDPDGHPNQVFSFLNYGTRPWVNGPVDEMIRPLPWDLGQLRKLYPASESRTEVAAMNTWVQPNFVTKTGSTVGLQKLLCAPSVGKGGDSSKMFQPNCGNTDATSICPGDTVQIQYTAANYSTEPVTITANYWFSTDDTWQQSDSMSSSAAGYMVDAADADPEMASVVVPTLPGMLQDQYYLIVRLTATSMSGVVVHDSIPLRGRLTRPASCGTGAGQRE